MSRDWSYASKLMESIERKNFQALPGEIKLLVFSYFKTYEVKHVLSPVCREWRELSNDKTLHTEISVTIDNGSRLSYLGDYLLRSGLLRKLTITGTEDRLRVSRVLGKCFKSLPFLKVIDLRYCHIGPTFIKLLTTNCKRIESLSLRNCHSSFDKPTTVYSEICHIVSLVNLRSLTLEEVLTIDSKCIELIAKESHKLESLNILPDKVYTPISLEDESIFHLVKYRCETLRHLSLQRICLTDVGFSALQYLQNLTYLELWFSNADDMTEWGVFPNLVTLKLIRQEGGLRLERAHEENFLPMLVRNCKRIEKLKLVNIPADHYSYQLNDITSLSNLRSLKLTTNFGKYDEFIRNLSKNCSNLESLHLESSFRNFPQSTHFTDSSFLSLSEFRSDTLRKLSLCNVEMTQKGAFALGQCQKLTQLYLKFSEDPEANVFNFLGPFPFMEKLFLGLSEDAEYCLGNYFSYPEVIVSMDTGIVNLHTYESLHTLHIGAYLSSQSNRPAGVTDSFIDLADLADKLINLHYLSLYNCVILEDYSNGTFVSAVKKFKKLRMLNCYHGTAYNCIHVVLIPEVMPNMKNFFSQRNFPDRLAFSFIFPLPLPSFCYKVSLPKVGTKGCFTCCSIRSGASLYLDVLSEGLGLL